MLSFFHRFSVFLLVFFFSFCSPSKLSNSCDPKTDSYLTSTILRFLLKDSSPSCLPGFGTLVDWGAHGSAQVYDVLVEGGRLLFAGSFEFIGPNTGSAAIVDGNSGKLSQGIGCPYWSVDGPVSQIISDGVGGYYLAGNFQNVQGHETKFVARILSNCKVDKNFQVLVGSINSSPRIDALAVFGNRIYIGGQFTNWDGLTRTNLVVLDARTGELEVPLDLSLSGGQSRVNSLLVDNGYLYVGGSFELFAGSVSVWSIIRIDLSSHTLDSSFQSNVDGGVESILTMTLGTLASGERVLFAAGTANTPRAHSLTTGIANSNWTPTTNSFVNAIAQVGNDILIVGDFTVANGEPSPYYARLDNNTGILLSDPSDLIINQTINSGFLHNGVFYIFGNFETINGQTRRYGAGIVAGREELTAFDPNLSFPTFPGYGKGMGIPGSNQVAVVGVFTSLNVVARKNLAAIDLTTGEPLPWNPEPNFLVRHLRLHNGNLFVAGDFTQISGQTTMKMAAYQWSDLGFAYPIEFDGSEIRDIQFLGDTMYVGGDFLNIRVGSNATVSRDSLVAISTNNRSVDETFDADVSASSSVNSIYLGSPGELHIGGSFITVSSSNEPFWTVLNPSTGAPTSKFTIFPDNPIQSVNGKENQICAVGSFGQIGTISNPKFACYTEGFGFGNTNISFMPGQPFNLHFMETGPLVVSGDFLTVNAESRLGVAVFDGTTFDLEPTVFTQNGSAIIVSKRLAPNTLAIMGNFTQWNRFVKGGFAIESF